LSSTYLKWILVAIALAVGVWVVARPSGRSKPDAARADPSRTDAARTDPAHADPASAGPDDDGHAYSAPADAARFATPANDATAVDGTALDRTVAHRDDETVAAQDGRYVARTGPPAAVARVPAPRAAPDGLAPSQNGPPSNGARPAGESPAQSPAGSALGLWSDGYPEDVWARWRELQLRFIDDPQSVAGEAELVIDEAVASLTASVNARKDELRTWRSGSGEDTEQLRAAVNRYREFLDRLLRV
jgi:hypothetical protein